MSKRPRSQRAETVQAKKKKNEPDESILTFDASWAEFGEATSKGIKPVLYLDGPEIKPSEKIAAFDLDSTLVVTASGRKFAIGANDWKILSDKVIPKLKAVHDDGYKIVIISNQGGIEKQKTTVKDVIGKFTGIVAELGIPMQVFLSTGESQYRKPATGIWEFMAVKCNGGVKIDLQKSYYVGDAAGRQKNWSKGKPKDFSCSDRMFASNIGIGFHTPEEYFDGESPALFVWGSINPVEVLNAAKSQSKDLPFPVGKGSELIIMVGPPASGKSTFSKRHLEPKGFVTVNRDTLKTREKCIQVAKDAVANGKSVVVDNTNPSKEARRDFVDIAKKKKIPCRCVVTKTSLELAHHLNLYRQSQTKGKVRRIPDVGYNTYKSRFEEPSLDEGFTEIISLDFVPVFDTKKDEELFKAWTC